MSVTDGDVKSVVTTTDDTSPLIDVAEGIVADHLSSKGLSSTQLDRITLFLTAHLVVLKDENGGLRRDRMGEADQSFKTPGDKNEGLSGTRYGQMAMMLDTSGTLAGLDARATALPAIFGVMGSRISDAGIETP